MIIFNQFKLFFAPFAALPSEAKAKEGFAPFAVKKKFKHKFKIPTIIVTLTFPIFSFSQNYEIADYINSFAEELAAGELNESALGFYMEELYELSADRVKINNADINEISRLFFLNEFQAASLIDHITTTGPILSVYEIAAIPGFDRQTAELISPFIDLGIPGNKAAANSRLHNTFLSNLIIKPGESDTGCIGSSIKSLTKYRFSAGRISGSFSTEKDAGEKFADFVSGNIAFTGKGALRKIIAGDFSACFGQGVNVNTGMRTGLLLTSQGYMSSGNQIRTYNSTGENNFFRGFAAQTAFKKMESAFWFSHNYIDATLKEAEDSSSHYVVNFYEAGLHNTPTLLLKKDAVSETSFGVNVVAGFRNIKTGICYSETRFSKTVMPDIKDPVYLFSFNGNISRTVSAYYSSMIKKILLYGELALNDLRSHAFVQGFTLRPSDRLSVNFLYRDYSPRYFSFHGSGPGSSTATSNEKGLLGNFTFEAAKHLFVSAGVDFSVSPWLRYRCSFPSYSKRTEIKLNYKTSEKIDVLLTFNIRYKLTDINDNSGIAGIGESASRWLKGQIRYRPVENVSITTRIDYKISEPSGSKGMAFLQDITITAGKMPVSLWARYCIYNTGDWDSRIFTYENDLPQSFSIPALSGVGTRSYLMLKWEIGKMAELRIRYSVTSLESGIDIEEKDELKFQIRIWF